MYFGYMNKAKEIVKESLPSTSAKLHLRIPVDLYHKLLGRSEKERRSGHNLALYLIEKGLGRK